MDVARLSGDPQKSAGANANEVASGGTMQYIQRGQASLTLPLNRYHGNTITSAAIVHHSHPTNQPQFMHSTNPHFEAMTPTIDGAGGRMSLSTFSSGNANFTTTNIHQVNNLT